MHAHVRAPTRTRSPKPAAAPVLFPYRLHPPPQSPPQVLAAMQEHDEKSEYVDGRPAVHDGSAERAELQQSLGWSMARPSTAPT